MTIQEIFTKYGYRQYAELSNRKKVVQNINRTLAAGKIDIQLAKPGKVWLKDGQRWSVQIFVKVTEDGRGYIFKYKPNIITPNTILLCLTKVIQKPKVSKAIGSYLANCPECNRCNGKGILPHYMHVANGVCFRCLGTGYDATPIIKHYRN